MSDGEGSTQSTTAVETGSQLDNSTTTTTTAVATMDGQQNVAITKDDGEPNPKKAKLSMGGADVFGRGGCGGGDKVQTASDKLEHRLGGILCCAVCLDLPRSAIYQVSSTAYVSRSNTRTRPLIGVMTRTFHIRSRARRA